MDIIITVVITVVLVLIILYSIGRLQHFKYINNLEVRDHIETKKKLLRCEQYIDSLREEILDDIESNLHRKIYFETYDGQIVNYVNCKPIVDKQGYLIGYDPYIRKKNRHTDKWHNAKVFVKLIRGKKLVVPKK